MQDGKGVGQPATCEAKSAAEGGRRDRNRQAVRTQADDPRSSACRASRREGRCPAAVRGFDASADAGGNRSPETRAHVPRGRDAAARATARARNASASASSAIKSTTRLMLSARGGRACSAQATVRAGGVTPHARAEQAPPLLRSVPDVSTAGAGAGAEVARPAGLGAKSARNAFSDVARSGVLGLIVFRAAMHALHIFFNG